MLNPIEKFKRSILHLNKSLHHCVHNNAMTSLRKFCFGQSEHSVTVGQGRP